MASEDTPIETQVPEGMQLDFQKIANSYQRQIAEQANTIAVKDAIIDTQREQIAHLRQMVDEIAPKPNREERRATAKKSAPKIPTKKRNKP